MQTAAAAGPRPYKLNPAHCTLTYVGSAQSFAQRPRPDVRSLAVDGQTLDAADEAAIRPRGPDQPVGIGGPAHIQRRSEGDLAVLALVDIERGSAITAARTKKKKSNQIKGKLLLSANTTTEPVIVNQRPSLSRPSVLCSITCERPDMGVSLSIRSQPLIPSLKTVTVCH